MSTKTSQWQQRIQQIKEKLGDLGDMRPGALGKQFNVCGKAGCRCKDPHSPKKHGPYYQLSYTHQGKSTSEFVKKHAVAETRQQLRTYAKFKKLTDEWVALSIKLAKARKKEASR